MSIDQYFKIDSLSGSDVERILLDIDLEFKPALRSSVPAGFKPHLLQHQEFESFLVWSSVWHYFEAWQYLKQAISAFHNRSFNQCVHLAYYSELRFAMSLFNLNGACIFGNSLYYSNGTSPVSDSLTGTHKIANKLVAIMSNQIFVEKVNQSINYRNLSIDEYITSLKSSSSPSFSALFTTIHGSSKEDFIGKDKAHRNTVSYQVHYKMHDEIQDQVMKETLQAVVKYVYQEKSNELLSRYILKEQIKSIGKDTDEDLKAAEINEISRKLILTETEFDRFLGNSKNCSFPGLNYPFELMARSMIFSKIISSLISSKASTSAIDLSDLQKTLMHTALGDESFDIEELEDVVSSDDPLIHIKFLPAIGISLLAR